MWPFSEIARLRARVATLEFALNEANDWLRVGEGVDLLYYWPPDIARTIRAEVGSLIRLKDSE